MVRRRGPWWHVPDPELSEGEHVVLRERANRFQGRRAVGGALYVTTHRLAFRPHRFDHALRGRDRDIAIQDIAAVDIAERDGRLAYGGLVDRLRVHLRDGGVELLVVERLAGVVATVHSQLTQMHRGANDSDGDEREQLRLAMGRRTVLRAVVAAQQRPLEVTEAISRSTDRDAAASAVAVLLGIDDSEAAAVVDMPWRNLCQQRREQASTDLEEIEQTVRRLKDQSRGRTEL